MRELFGVVAIIALLGLLGVQSEAADDKKADTDSLEGTWVVTGLEFGGKKIDLPKGMEISMTFKGGKVTKKETGKKDEEGTYKVNNAKKPMELDLTNPKEKDPTMMETTKAIYSLDGDSLKIAFAGPPDVPRPTGFDAKDIGIMTLKKAKK